MMSFVEAQEMLEQYWNRASETWTIPPILRRPNYA